MDQSVQTAATSAVENVAASLKAHLPITFREEVQQTAGDIAFWWLGHRAPGDEDRSQRVSEALDRSAHINVAIGLVLRHYPSA